MSKGPSSLYGTLQYPTDTSQAWLLSSALPSALSPMFSYRSLMSEYSMAFLNQHFKSFNKSSKTYGQVSYNNASLLVPISVLIRVPITVIKHHE